MIINEDNYKDFGLSSFSYKPSVLFKLNDVNTIFPYLFRGLQSTFHDRKRFETPDLDFFDVDIIYKNSTKALILLHGLEGSSCSQYIRGMIYTLQDIKIDVFAVNHRSCSGALNLSKGFYHSGFTKDLKLLVEKLCKSYKEIFVVGYSLGGNIALKYAGEENEIPYPLKKIVAVSVPIDLSASAVRLNQWSNKHYAMQFLLSLKKKAVAKAKQFNYELPYSKEYHTIKTLYEYDNKVTAPLHNFIDAEDYYAKCSSLPLLKNISIPTLLINAHDDSFLQETCFPFKIAKHHPHFHFLATKYGGHVGFSQLQRGSYWVDQVVKEWLNL